jgi:hypothetical protein
VLGIVLFVVLGIVFSVAARMVYKSVISYFFRMPRCRILELHMVDMFWVGIETVGNNIPVVDICASALWENNVLFYSIGDLCCYAGK